MIYFTAHTFKCVCHCRRAMFRVLGMYNFDLNLKLYLDFLYVTWPLFYNLIAVLIQKVIRVFKKNRFKNIFSVYFSAKYSYDITTKKGQRKLTGIIMKQTESIKNSYIMYVLIYNCF